MAATYSGSGVDNSITTIVKMISTKMDEIVKKESVTAGMNASSEIVQAFNGSATAKLPTMSTDGLGDYDKVKGYPVGAATIEWTDYTLAYDRGIKIDIDRKDKVQTDGLASTAAAAAQLMRLQVIPEIDATRLSGAVSKTKAALASHVVEETAAPTKANLLSKIGVGLDTIYEERGVDSGSTIYLNNNMKSVLRESSEYTKVKQISGVPNIDLTTESIDGNPIVWVPSARMKTIYSYNTPGATSGNKGGIAPGTDAQDIYFVIVAPGCAQGVTVFSEPKFIDASINQSKDADSLMYRLYHDVIVEKNSGASGIYAQCGKKTG